MLEGIMRSHSLRLLSLLVVSSFVVLAAPAQAGSTATSGVAIGFARIKLGDMSVSAFGGKGTKSVTTGLSGGTGVAVSFSGKFPKNLIPDQVIVQATAEAAEPDLLAVANAVVSLASATQIVVVVNGWIANTTTPVDGYVFVTLYSGLPPQP
jgi:hypothetical protein